MTWKRVELHKTKVSTMRPIIIKPKIINPIVILSFQIYADEKHTLGGVKPHLYKSMINYLENCFRKLVPPDLKSGLRNGGMSEPTSI